MYISERQNIHEQLMHFYPADLIEKKYNLANFDPAG